MIGYVLKQIKKLPFYRRYTTSQFEQWWARRKIDWDKDYLRTWDHPHRHFITENLKLMSWKSLIEIGCGPGPNLMNIVKAIPRVQIGGVDVSPEAIALAQKTFTGGYFRVDSGENVFMSDKSSDIILTDMTLIYVGPRKIDKYVVEMKRLARSFVVLSEFHSRNWWERFKLRLFSGHNAYDYQKLLEKHGFHDIIIQDYPPNCWPLDDNTKFRKLIIARPPKYI